MISSLQGISNEAVNSSGARRRTGKTRRPADCEAPAGRRRGRTDGDVSAHAGGTSGGVGEHVVQLLARRPPVPQPLDRRSTGGSLSNDPSMIEIQDAGQNI